MPVGLEGFRILELAEGLGAAYAGRLLAQYGAEVVKIEPPTGDAARHHDLVGEGAPDPERSALFHHLNGGKRSVVADLSTGEGRRGILELAGAADIVLEDFGPNRLDNLGMGWEHWHERYPAAWRVSLSPFGSYGPYAGYRLTPLTAYAVGGQMYMTGDPDRPTVQYGFQGDYQAGLHGFSASVLALHQATLGRAGQRIEIATMEVEASQTEEMAPHASIHDHLSRLRLGNKLGALWSFYPAADGWMGIFGIHPNFRQVAETLDMLEIVDGDRYTFDGDNFQNADELEARITGWTIERTRRQAFDCAGEKRAPFTMVMSPAEVMAWEPLQDAGFWRTLDHPSAGSVTVPGPAITLGTGNPPLGRAPLLGEHTATAIEAWRDHGSVPAAPYDVAPLAGIRVIDMTIVWSGPLAAATLADMGAEVIKIEGPGAVESTRPFGLMTEAEQKSNVSPYVAQYSRNKLGFGVDLKSTEGRQLLLELAAKSDIVIDNFRPGVMERLGLAYADLRAVNPRIIVLQMPGFASRGPEAERAAYGPVVEAMSGFCGLGGVEGEPPLFSGISYSDPVAGTLAVGAALIGLLHRERTGQGQRIELSQRNNMINMIGEAYVEHSLTGRTPPRLGVRHPTWAPQGLYPCRPLPEAEAPRLLDTDERYVQRWLTLSVTSDEEWHAFTKVVALTGGPDLSGERRYATAAGRRQAHDEIDRQIQSWTCERDAFELFHALQAAGVAAAPVMHAVDQAHDPHLAERGYYQEIPHPYLGTRRISRPIWGLSATPQRHRRGAPLVGEHNESILRDVLGKSDSEIAELTAAGAVWRPESSPYP